MSWRLPSGKALAEFALQSGFLAPLMLGGVDLGSSSAKARKRADPLEAAALSFRKQEGEGPESSGTFRGSK